MNNWNKITVAVMPILLLICSVLFTYDGSNFLSVASFILAIIFSMVVFTEYKSEE